VKELSTAFVKIAALFSFCGGPLLVSAQLKPRFGAHVAFLVTIAPVLVMAIGTLFLEDDVEDRIARAAVWCGRQGLYVVLAMHAYAIWWFAHGFHVSEQWLYYTGIVVGLIWSTVYLRAGRRWVVARNRSAGTHAGRDGSPIEPS
jgi:drug/metabolite transporter (DMT)-like permease